MRTSQFRHPKCNGRRSLPVSNRSDSRSMAEPRRRPRDDFIDPPPVSRQEARHAHAGHKRKRKMSTPLRDTELESIMHKSPSVYEKRPRNKTRENRYEQNRHKETRRHTTKQVVGHGRRREAPLSRPCPDIMERFHSDNIKAERVTVR